METVQAEEIQRVLVIGAGTMGQQIGDVCALHGLDVWVYDASAEALDAAALRVKRRATRSPRTRRQSPPLWRACTTPPTRHRPLPLW